MALHTKFPCHLERVWVYLRKSREDREAEARARREGRDHIETLSRHRRTLLELAHQHGHHVSAVLEEVVSGEFISERPEMTRLLAAVEQEQVCAVWVMDLDRLGRGDMADQGTILRAFKDTHTLILTPDKVYDLADEMDEEWTEFKTFFARRELKMITKRMQRGRIATVKEGKFIGTRPPFGYDVNKDLILVPNGDAPVVRQVFDLYVNGGLGSSRIAHRLNTLGIKTPMGKQWRGETVLAVLRNPVYAGWIVWKRVQHDKRRGTYRQRPRKEWIEAIGRHQPLVDEITFERAVQIRKRRSHAPVKQNHTVSSVLTGLVTCAKCGQTLVKRPYQRQAPHLICKNPECPQKSTRLSIVEERIIQALTAWLHDYPLSCEDVSAAMLSRRSDSLASVQMLRNIDNEIDQLDRQHDNLHTLLERGVYDERTFADRKQKLELQVADLRRRRQAVSDDLQHANQLSATAAHALPDAVTVLEAYAATDDVSKRNALLRSVLERAVYNKEKSQQGDQFELTLFPLV